MGRIQEDPPNSLGAGAQKRRCVAQTVLVDVERNTAEPDWHPCEEVECLGASMVPGQRASSASEFEATTEAGEKELIGKLLTQPRGVVLVPPIDGYCQVVEVWAKNMLV